MISLAMTFGTTGIPVFELTNSNVVKLSLEANTNLASNTWNHFAITVNATDLLTKFYINGILCNSAYSSGSFSLYRKYNYLGLDSFNQTTSDSKIDEIKIFNRVLSQKEISFEMNNNIY